MPIKTFIPQNQSESPFNQTKRKNKSVTMADNYQAVQAKNARMWQIFALVSTSSFFISLGIVFYAVRLPKSIPVIVTVNESGEAKYYGEVNSSYIYKDKIPESSKVYCINKLIKNMYTVYIDRAAQQQGVSLAQSVVQDGAVAQLDSFFQANNPFDDFGARTKSVTVEAPLKQTDNVYVVYFNVLTKTRDGYALADERFSCLITLGLYQISIENPLGIYVTNFDIKPV